MVVIDGGGDGDDVEAGFAQFRLVRGEFDLRRFDDVVSDFIGGVDAFSVEVDLRLVQVESDDADLFGEGHRDRHTDVAESDQRKFRFPGKKLFVDVKHFCSPCCFNTETIYYPNTFALITMTANFKHLSWRLKRDG